MSGWYMIFLCHKPGEEELVRYHVIPMGNNNTPIPTERQLIALPIGGKETQVTVLSTLCNYVSRNIVVTTTSIYPT